MRKVLSHPRTSAVCGLYLRATPTHNISTESAKCKFIPVLLYLSLGHTSVAWAQSEPPRGSGWVRRRQFRNINKIERVYDVPTRYREVVLTVSKPGSDS
jgi:hypothetical protein